MKKREEMEDDPCTQSLWYPYFKHYFILMSLIHMLICIQFVVYAV